MTPRAPRPKRAALATTRTSARHSANALRRADELANLFKVMGNANRLKIIVYLDEQARSVGEIEAALKIHQPTLSQQLGELREAGLVTGHKVTKSVIYALTQGLGRRALETIYLANGHVAQRAPPPPSRPVSNQAAVFASILSTRGSQATEWQPGFNSLLRE